MKCHGHNELEMNSERCDSDVRERGGTALQAGRSRVRFPIGSFGFFSDSILPAALRTWRNVYQKYFLGGKGDRWGA